MPTQKLLERKALIVGIVINVLQVLAGVAVFFMTGLKAMFLDFSFTAISVLSGMVAVYLSSRTVRTTSSSWSRRPRRRSAPRTRPVSSTATSSPATSS